MHLRPPSLSLLAAALCALPATSLFFNKPALQYHPAPPSERYAVGDPEEQELFAKHWWPLPPPPGHHPDHLFTREELAAVAALVENYTRYWRSLPRYPKDSPLLWQAEQDPYLPADVTTASPTWWQRTGVSTAKLFFIEHHKMGVDLVFAIQKALRGKVPSAQLFEPFPVQCPPKDAKLIQMVRRPVDAILSGFRYHQNQWAQEVYSWGHSKKQDPPCFECSQEDHAAMFETCGFNCTYFELLNRVDNITGATIEALSQRTPIISMLNSLARCGHRKEVLYLSVDLFQADSARAAACLMRFLGLEEGGDLQERLTELVMRKNPMHVTSGKYDDAAPRAYLQGHPAWGHTFAEIDRVLETMYHRQAGLYGCPVPKFTPGA